ncbi:MAG: hypothetical protein GX607_19760 [Myxococcales bacterium]|jgi:OOP family OmpA-OmpF porin|nr:hypothetical protein [Myxococcales bacterium]
MVKHFASQASRTPQSWSRRAGPLALAIALLAAPDLVAQERIEGDLAVQRFDPAPGPRNFITTRSARTDGDMAWTAGAFVHYGYRPFEIRRCPAGGCDGAAAAVQQDFRVVENLVTGDLMGSFTPLPRLQLGGRLPVTWARGHGTEATEDGGLQAVGLGDMLLEAKGRLSGDASSPIATALALYGTVPFGTLTAKDSYIGDGSPSVGVRAIVDGVAGPWAWGVNVGGAWRKAATIGDTRLGPEMRYGAAVAYSVSPVVRVIGDVFGSTNFSGSSAAHGAELDGALQYTPLGVPMAITAGLGTGVMRGIGYPHVRAFVGVTFSNEVRDRDGDGIPDALDECPNDPEDFDGFEDRDGCPDRDNDGDGIPDEADRCPNEPEDLDGFEDEDGCPDPDNDGDGIPDDLDACPNEPETVNGYRDDDGCPDTSDRDKDGIPDELDQCPDEPEDTDGFEDEDGCPDPDNDGDGIPDIQDECVDEPETFNGFEDEDGCPDEVPTR